MTQGFGAELRRLRRAKGVSLLVLARQVNYSKGHLSKIENGLAQPAAVLAELCDEALQTGGVLTALMQDPRYKVAGRSRKNSPPSGIPRDTVHFKGREAEFDEIVDVLSAGPGADSPGLGVICVIAGMGGIGKTALAVRAAHGLKTVFPHGCLFIDLHGNSDIDAVSPAEALERLLRRLGFSGEEIPVHVEERAALFREFLAGKRLLLVLDNAHDYRQVLPLLPATNRCGVIITSRNALRSLEDVHRVSLAPLLRADAEALLKALCGYASDSGNSSAEASISDITEWCGGLPLAIRIISARLRADAEYGLSDGATRERYWLSELDDGSRSVTTAFDLSFRALGPEAQRTFLMLGLHMGTDFEPDAVAALVGTELGAARGLLGLLLDASLLMQLHPGRFCFHDLVRTFAYNQALATLAASDRDAAMRRLINHYLVTLDLADRLITPHRYRGGFQPEESARLRRLQRYDQALNWIGAEQDNLVAACRAAYTSGLDSHCWKLAFALRGFFFLTRPWDIWIETHLLAAQAARRAGDIPAEGRTLNNLGLALLERGDYDAADVHFMRARELFQEVGDRHGEHTTIAHRAWVYFHRGEIETALRDSKVALDYVEIHGSPRNEAILLRDIALIEIELQRFGETTARLNAALKTFKALGLHLDAAMALNCLGEVNLRLGLREEAHAFLLEAIESARYSGSRFEQARAHDTLGQIAAENRDAGQAHRQWTLAFELYSELHDIVRARRIRSRLDVLQGSSIHDPKSGTGEE
jgi:tetratricopeptide (TPR) repeat protein/transcriptional regulator with XRE-family HTH domain